VKPTLLRPLAPASPALPAPPRPAGGAEVAPLRPRLGQLLVDRGLLSPEARRAALDRQARHDAQLGEILLAARLIDGARLYENIARQFGALRADLQAEPPDPALAAAIKPSACLRHGLLPWKHENGVTLIATSRPAAFAEHLPALRRRFGAVKMAVTTEDDLQAAVAALRPAQLIRRAETRVPSTESCRAIGFAINRAHPAALAGFMVLVIVLAFHPAASLRLLTIWAVLTLLGTSWVKLAALLATLRGPDTPALPAEPPPVIPRLPRVSLLVPLFNEQVILTRLVDRLDRLDYPRELLDILLVVEAEDAATRRALAALELPPQMRALVVPAGTLKTKPRALNYALDFCRGTLVGVYDAEDAPDPGQIHAVVRRFHARGPRLACVQATLDFYNARRNWLARCFAVEYAAWFRVVLPGMARLGLVVPLGGTSLFFRRDVLERLGGWDAHNVTEDADLGLRLARHGYETEFVESVTAEEANCGLWPWVRQRSRWLKGYMMTWTVHMRHPLTLWRELGARKFWGVQLLFLGTISQFLLAPVLWLFWLVPLGLTHPFAPALGTGAPAALIDRLASGALLGAFLLAEAISLAVMVYAVRGPGHRHLLPWVVTLHFYFPLAALAAWRGLFELLTRPFYWDKTEHGRFGGAEPCPASAPAARGAAPSVAAARR
jgi:cellulose synthase/poly-beta-1,6-N-acetylglucosamine synthase-like glycosyltransferase